MSTKLNREQLVPGALVVVGPATLPNGRTDHSWCDAVWRIEATSGEFILCRRMTRLNGYADVIHMAYSERQWWEGEHILDAYRRAEQEASAEYKAQREQLLAATEPAR